MSATNLGLPLSGTSAMDEIHRLLPVALQSWNGNLNYVFDLLPGVFPSEIATALLEVDSEESAKVRKQLFAGVPPKAKVQTGRHLPHPLDYEWMFTAESTDAMGRLVSEEGRKSVLCLGTPSIYDFLKGQFSNSICGLIDRPEVCEIRKAHGSVSGFVTSIQDCSNSDGKKFSAAVVDGPWYLEYLTSFVQYAAAFVEVGGTIWSVVPPIMTRPGIHEERVSIIAALQILGIELEKIHKSLVRYQAPPFEVATLRKLGLNGVPHDWRTGDVMQLKVTREVDLTRLSLPVPAESWRETRCGFSRVKFRIQDDQSLDTRLSCFTEGNILPSVSRRDPLRSLATVWTSGNQCFHCPASNVLGIGFGAHVLGIDPISEVERVYGRIPNQEQAGWMLKSIADLNETLLREEEELEWIQ